MRTHRERDRKDDWTPDTPTLSADWRAGFAEGVVERRRLGFSLPWNDIASPRQDSVKTHARSKPRKQEIDRWVPESEMSETYRPRQRERERERRPSPSRDSYRSGRDRRSPPPSHGYQGSSRRRSITPPRDYGRPRSRSPYRGGRGSPRRDRDRSPPRDERRRSRSPAYSSYRQQRARSPINRRSRSRSRSPRGGLRGLAYRGPRSPDRRDSRLRSVERQDTRPRSPNRRDSRYNGVGQHSSNLTRDSRLPAHSPSPRGRDSEPTSARTSGSTSRRPSPPQIHPSRLPIVAPSVRNEAISRSPAPRSPPNNALAYRDRPDSARSTPRRERSPTRPVAAPRSPPRGPSGFRAPPTGPSPCRNFNTSARSAAILPSASHSSASARTDFPTPTGPPAGPRGYLVSAWASYSSRVLGRTFGSDRQNRPEWGAAPNRTAETSIRATTPVSKPAPAPISTSVPSTTPAPAPAQTTSPVISSSSIPTGPAIPTGPRAGIPSRPSNAYGPRQTVPTASGPRPHPAMANLPQIIPGGRIDLSISGQSAADLAREKKLKEEEGVLRGIYEAKQDKLRKELKMFERLQRDSALLQLRSELSESHVRMLAGEGLGGAAF